MRLIKRIVADIRGPDQGDSEVEMMVNEKLIELQTDNDGNRNKNIQIIDIHEVTKDSGIQNFVVVYEDSSLDLTPKPNK